MAVNVSLLFLLFDRFIKTVCDPKLAEQVIIVMHRCLRCLRFRLVFTFRTAPILGLTHPWPHFRCAIGQHANAFATIDRATPAAPHASHPTHKHTRARTHAHAHTARAASPRRPRPRLSLSSQSQRPSASFLSPPTHPTAPILPLRRYPVARGGDRGDWAATAARPPCSVHAGGPACAARAQAPPPRPPGRPPPRRFWTRTPAPAYGRYVSNARTHARERAHTHARIRA